MEECYKEAGSFSRSAVNYNAGAQTTVSNIIMSTTVLITLLFLMPLFHYTPNVILGTIIVTVVIGLIDYEAVLRLWKVDNLISSLAKSPNMAIYHLQVRNIPRGTKGGFMISFEKIESSLCFVPSRY